jgi:hypothetical protein
MDSRKKHADKKTAGDAGVIKRRRWGAEEELYKASMGTSESCDHTGFSPAN